MSGKREKQLRRLVREGAKTVTQELPVPPPRQGWWGRLFLRLRCWLWKQGAPAPLVPVVKVAGLSLEQKKRLQQRLKTRLKGKPIFTPPPARAQGKRST